MANPFARARWFHRLGHLTNTQAWRLLPTPVGLAVLTTTARRSGKQRVRAVRAMREGARVYAVAMLGQRCDWLHNIRANPDVRVKLGSHMYEAHAREIVDPGEREQMAAVYLQHAGWFDYADFANLMWSVPTRSKIRRSHERWLSEGVPVVFELIG